LNAAVEVFIGTIAQHTDRLRSIEEGPPDYNIAWILLNFLGIFGIHRMYMGKRGTGMLYLCTFGLLM